MSRIRIQAGPQNEKTRVQLPRLGYQWPTELVIKRLWAQLGQYLRSNRRLIDYSCSDASFQHAAMSPGLNGSLLVFSFTPDLAALRWADPVASNAVNPSYSERVGWRECPMEQCLLSKHTDATHPRIPTATIAIQSFRQ